MWIHAYRLLFRLKTWRMRRQKKTVSGREGEEGTKTSRRRHCNRSERRRKRKSLKMLIFNFLVFSWLNVSFTIPKTSFSFFFFLAFFLLSFFFLSSLLFLLSRTPQIHNLDSYLTPAHVPPSLSIFFIPFWNRFTMERSNLTCHPGSSGKRNHPNVVRQMVEITRIDLCTGWIDEEGRQSCRSWSWQHWRSFCGLAFWTCFCCLHCYVWIFLALEEIGQKFSSEWILTCYCHNSFNSLWIRHFLAIILYRNGRRTQVCCQVSSLNSETCVQTKVFSLSHEPRIVLFFTWDLCTWCQFIQLHWMPFTIHQYSSVS